MIVDRGISGIQDTLDSFNTYSPIEWAVIIGGAYLAWSVLFTTKHHVDYVGGKVSRIKSKSAKRKALLDDLSEL